MSRLRPVCRGVLLALCVQSTAWAQPQSGGFSLEEEDMALAYGNKATISIATGSKQTLRRAPAVASVVTAEDIANMGATDLDEVLETIAGLHVSRSPNSYTPVYVIRGVFSQQGPQTLVLQNGVPMTTVFLGNRGNVWAGLPVENIARIEVIRGPGSALYGADAYSGVINIITKTAADVKGTEFGARLGSFSSRDAWIQHGGKLGVLDVAAYLRVGSTDGFRETVASDAQTRNDLAFGTRASLAPGPVNTGRDAMDANLDMSYGKFRLRGNYKLRDDVGTGPGIGSALDPDGSSRSSRITSDLSWIDPQITDDWGVGISASYFYYKEIFDLQIFPPGTRFPTGVFPEGMKGSPNRWERQYRLSAYATYTGLQNHSIRMGAGHDQLDLYKTQEFKNFTFAPNGLPVPQPSVTDFTNIAPFITPHKRNVDYIYLQDEWGFAKDWTLTFGVRTDHYSDFGNTTNPRVALVWDTSYELTTKLLYGRAFRAPAFNELFSISNPTNRGNPDLDPETISTLELAFAWQARKDLQLNLNLFRSDLKDIIRALPNAVAGTGSTYFNTGSQRGQGFELESLWDIRPGLRLSANYAFQKSTDEATNQDAGNAPRHQWYTRLDWQMADHWQFNTQVKQVADRKRVKGDTRPDTPDYTALDFGVQYAPQDKQGWRLSAFVKNAFNADVREPSVAPGLVRDDLPQAGRAWFIQAMFSL